MTDASHPNQLSSQAPRNELRCSSTRHSLVTTSPAKLSFQPVSCFNGVVRKNHSEKVELNAEKKKKKKPYQSWDPARGNKVGKGFKGSNWNSEDTGLQNTGRERGGEKLQWALASLKILLIAKGGHG